MPKSIRDFIKIATKEQKDLLFKLNEAVEQEHKYIDVINKIYDSRKFGVYSSDGFSLAVCEDEDDAILISMRPREELKRIREQIKPYMKRAVELGMGHLGIIQRNYEHYVGEPLPRK